MKRTRAATQTASKPATEAAPAKPATRRVRAKLETQPKAAANKAKPKADVAKPRAAVAQPKAAAKAGGKALKQTTLKGTDANHSTTEPPSQPTTVQRSPAKAAALVPSPVVAGKRGKRPAPLKAAPADNAAPGQQAPKTSKAATPSKAASKAANASRSAAKAATQSTTAAEATSPSKAAAKVTTPKKAASRAANPSKGAAKAAAGQMAIKVVTSPRKHAAQTAAKPLSPSKRELFDQYRQEGDEDIIGPDGVERLCSDLDLSPEDRKVLLLAWKTGAKRMGFFSREEFRRGLDALSAKTVAALKQALPKLAATVAASEAAAQDFYQFAFRYCLTDGQKKFVEAETAAQMLGVVLPDGPLTARLQEFLAEQTEYKVISADQWLGMYRFCQEVKPDFSNFDESQAWPVLLDNFVDWGRERLAQQEAGGQ